MNNNGTRNILKLERDSIAPFQKDLYNGDENNPNIGTRFAPDIQKMSHASHFKTKLDQVPIREGHVLYTASKKFDALHKLEAHVSLFPIKVKEGYRKTVSICYVHNLGHNILPFGECKIDDEHIESLDSIWMDIHSQYFVSKREIYNRMIGNLPCLEDWSTELPGISLVVPQPFSFSRKTHFALPLLKSSNNTVSFEYKTRTKLTDLIRMRIFYEGEFREIKCNLKYLECKSEFLPVPEMWGRYIEFTDEERNWKKSIDEKTGESTKHITYIEDVYSTGSKNPKSIGTSDAIPLESISPAKHIFWTASLVDAPLSNYTTNRDNVYEGWNPCIQTGLTYGGADRIPNLSNEHFDLSECYDFDWLNFPKEAGYNVHTFTFNPMDVSRSDNAVILKDCGAVLNVTLGNTNPFLDKDKEEEHYDEKGELIPSEIYNSEMNEDKKDKYNIHVRILVTRRLEVYWDDKSGKLKYVFT